MSKYNGSIWGEKPPTQKEIKGAELTYTDSIHTLIDSEGNSYNVSLTIRDNKLIAIWEGEEICFNLNKCNIEIKEN